MRGAISLRKIIEGQAGQLVFLGILLLYGIILLFSLEGLPDGAKTFPILVLTGAVVLWTVKLVATLAPPRWRALIEPRGLLPSVSALGSQTDASDKSTVAKPDWLLWIWLLASLIAMLAFGFLAGSALSIVGYMRLIARSSWRPTIVATAVTVLFIYLVFGVALRVDLDPVPLGVFLRP